MSRLLNSLLRTAPKAARRTPALRLKSTLALAALPKAKTLSSAATVMGARALGTTAVQSGSEAKKLIAATAKAKPEVVIAQSIFKSVVLDVPIGKAWDGIRAFAGTWIPDSVIALAPSQAEDGTHNVIGHSRIVTVVPLKKRLVEQLVGYNDSKYSYTYRTLAVEDGIFPAPFWNYVGTVRLYPITEGDKTLATWTANYETAPGPNAKALYAAIGDGTLAANLVAFNQYISNKK